MWNFGGENQLNDSLFLNIFFINLAFFSSFWQKVRDLFCAEWFLSNYPFIHNYIFLYKPLIVFFCHKLTKQDFLPSPTKMNWPVVWFNVLACLCFAVLYSFLWLSSEYSVDQLTYYTQSVGNQLQAN